MSTNQTGPEIGGLRHLAEERIAKGPAETNTTPKDAESARMLHELMVHQVELEMQNEELREARAEIEANAQHFTELYEFAPVGYFSLAADGVIRQLNFMGARLLGKERLVLLGRKFNEFVFGGNLHGFEGFLAGIFTGETSGPCEVALMRDGQDPAIVKLMGSLSPNGLVCRMVAMDITEHRSVEKSAREKSEDLERIFNLSSDIIGLATIDGRFTRLNPAFAALLGYTQEELIDRPFMDFVHPDDREATRQAMAELKAERDVLDFVNRQRCIDGSYRWIEWRVTPFRGEFICALGRDITERKQAQDFVRISEEKFRSIVESTPTAMYLYRLEKDDRLVLVGANPAADRETGIEHESLFGCTVEEAFPNLAGTRIPELYKSVARGELGTQTFNISYRDDRISGTFEVRVFLTGPEAIVVAFSDITERVRIEESLKKAQEELESRVQRRTAQLQVRTSQLRALASELTLAEERERRRIARLIHDHLQQMLVAALLNVGMLKPKLAEEALAADLAGIEGILRDSIDTTRSLTAELSPAVLHQCGLAAALKWLHTWCMEKYGLEVEVEADEGLDPGLDVSVTLFHCVRELLFNIVKHSGVKSASLRMWKTQNDMLKIGVSDNGAGFNPDLVRAREGAVGGFGLFNIRERLELLGGGLETESAPGSGSRFTLWVPVRNIPDRRDKIAADVTDRAMDTRVRPLPFTVSAGAAPSSGEYKSWKTRLVVADDHAAVREGLVKVLEAEPDFEVVGQAADGLEAIRLACQLRPHFVIMDINMPRINGLEATAAIHRELPCVKIMGLSTYADEEHRTAMIRAGATDLIHKNTPISQLVAVLRSHSQTPGCADCPAD